MNESDHQKQPAVWHNWVSLAGGILASGSLFAFVLLFAMDLVGAGGGNAYLGILTFVVAPAFLVAGIGLFLGGAWWHHRHRMRNPEGAAARLAIDLSRPSDRRRLWWVAAGAGTFLLLTAFGSYETYHITESVVFCGEVCHTPMEPEFTTYQRGEHARVACVECHVGSGAGWYLKSKINGTRQLLAVLTDSYQRPIGTPIHNLRPARETCERCHWPEKFTGNIDRSFPHVLSDDDNTEYTVRLLLHVGGAGGNRSPVTGIHWHMNPENRVEYFSPDAKRQTIPWVRVTKNDGTVTVYRSTDYKDEPSPAEIRTMDCMDCHNRPAHRYSTPNLAVEESMHFGRIPGGLTGFKPVAVKLLAAEYPDSDTAAAAIAAGLKEHYGDAAGLPEAVAEVVHIYRENFFPAMKADWRSYPENIGHKDSAGCFRCHDNNHFVADTKKTIPAGDCNACHTILAQGKGEQLSQLSATGQVFAHPGDEIPEGLLCNDCHNGQNQ